MITKEVLIEVGTVRMVAEGKDGQPTKVRCDQMSVTGKVNENGRMYEHEPWKRQIDRLQPKIIAGELVGSLDHPDDGKSRVADAAIKWTKIFMDGKVTIGEGVIIPTAAGRDLEAALKSGVPVGVSSRGNGSVVERIIDGKKVGVVADDFELLTFDAVLDPSVKHAQLALAEQKNRKPEFTEVQLRQRRIAGIHEAADASTKTETKEIVLTEAQRLMRRRAGLTEQAYFAPGQWHFSYDETPDEKHKVTNKLPDGHDLKSELQAALKKQGKDLEPLFPRSETSWVAYDSATKLLRTITFEFTDDGAIKILSLSESVQERFEKVLQEDRARIRQLAGLRG